MFSRSYVLSERITSVDAELKDERAKVRVRERRLRGEKGVITVWELSEGGRDALREAGRHACLQGRWNKRGLSPSLGLPTYLHLHPASLAWPGLAWPALDCM